MPKRSRTPATAASSRPLPVNNHFTDKLRQQEASLEAPESELLKYRLIKSAALLLILMFFSMGITMLGLCPGVMNSLGEAGIGIIEAVLAATILYINRAFFINGFKGLVNRAPNMDTLVALGSGVSYIWSLYVLINMLTGLGNSAGSELALGMKDLYFESAAMIVSLITVGKLLEAKAKGRTTDALKELIRLAPSTARVERLEPVSEQCISDEGCEGFVLREIELPVDELRPGDIIIVKAGERIPVDAEITEGSAAVDESALSGESMPVEKRIGDRLSAATISLNGYVKARAVRVGEDTTFAQIIRLVSDAAASKAPIARLADRIAGIFVPTIMAIAALTFIVWMLLGQGLEYSLSRAIAVLVISCPCALGLATPLAIMVASGVGAQKGILYKNAAAIEESGRIELVALDKTGTLTGGKPVVTEVFSCSGVSREELLEVAAALESRSEHPLARAISEYCGTTTLRIGDFEECPGGGVRAIMLEDNEFLRLAGGSADFVLGRLDSNEGDAFSGGIRVQALGEIEQELLRLQEEVGEYAQAGKSVVYFVKGARLLGMLALADSIRSDSAEAISDLRALGVKTIMLSGDRKGTAESIADELKLDGYYAELLPGDKERIIRELMKDAHVAMVGDGINDAPALSSANLGIAIAAGTDVAIEAADVVLVNDSLADLVRTLKLGRKTLKNIKENLFWAFFYNILLIPLAAGVYSELFSGWTLSPMLAAAAMSLSSLCVCLNALRLKLVFADEGKQKC